MLSILAACTHQSLDEFREEGETVNRQLVLELQKIRGRDDLLEHQGNLQSLFNQLVDIVIRAEEFKDTHPNASMPETSTSTADQLRIELNRILNMEGGREVLEKSQEEALNRLDAFERQRLAA